MDQEVDIKIEGERPARSKKRSVQEAELEIDVEAPEPPSKKALRKAKKAATKKSELIEEDAVKSEESDLKRLNDHESARSDHGVWIGNLAFTTAKRDLYKFLTNNSIDGGSITRLNLPQGNDNRTQNKGFAYVDFSSQDLVEQAVQLSEMLLGGRRLLIKDAKNFQGRPDKPKEQKAAPIKPPNRKIFIGNLDFNTSVQDLEKHFGVCGAILKTHMASFQDSGKCKGYAWTEFESLSAAEYAMRGWVEVDRPTKDEAGNKVMRPKKIWLHRMGDRKLRLEYAEDSTTRYKKRYGNEAGREMDEVDVEQAEPVVDDRSRPLVASSRVERMRQKPHSHESRGQGGAEKDGGRPNRKDRISRYDDKTVQKLTGAIVEGQGNKVVFQ